MANYSNKSGAGPKAMRNPIYWSRLYLQDTNIPRRKSAIAIREWNARWLNQNTNLNFFICGWVLPIIHERARFSRKDLDKASRLLDEAIVVRNQIAEAIDFATQRDLNKFATRLKRLFLHIIKLTIKGGVFAADEIPLTNAIYDKAEEKILLEYSNGNRKHQYLLGQPVSSKLEVISRKNIQSFEMLQEDLDGEDPVALLGGHEVIRLKAGDTFTVEITVEVDD